MALAQERIRKFEGVIREGRGGGAYVEVPFDVEAAFGDKRPAVKATMMGETFRWRLMKMGGPCHIVGVPKAIREKSGKSIGDVIEIALEADLEPRAVEVPEDLAAAMEAQGVRAVFERLSYTRRKEMALSIAEAKKLETRAKRIAQALKDLNSEG